MSTTGNIKFRYYTTNPNSISNSQAYYVKDANNQNTFCLKGIPDNPSFNGPASVQKCCPSNVTYTIANPGEANSFDTWTYPTGWTMVSQSGTSIVLKPDASTGGTVSCRVGLTTACPAIYKTASIAVTRNDADISIVTNEFPLDRICPNTSYTYKVNAVCGAASYTWLFPAGWSVSSGQGTTAVTVTTGAAPQSGNIIITANFNGCSPVSKSVAITPLAGAPPTPAFDPYHNNYHCSAWYVCRNGGRIYHTVQATAQTYTYTVSSPWRFINSSGQAVTTITLPYIQSPPLISLPSGTQSNSGTYTVKANNCLGTSAFISARFTRENDCWCNGTYPYPYQDGALNPCLNPPAGCEPTPLKAEKRVTTISGIVIESNTVFPNPAKGSLHIETIEAGSKIIRISTASGKVVYAKQTAQQYLTIAVSTWADGLYIAEIIKDNKTVFKQKVIITK